MEMLPLGRRRHDSGFDEAYERGMRLLKLELSKLDVSMFSAVNNSLINDGQEKCIWK